MVFSYFPLFSVFSVFLRKFQLGAQKRVCLLGHGKTRFQILKGLAQKAHSLYYSCIHTFKAKHPNPKSGLLSSESPLSASAISASKASKKKTFLEVVAAASYLLCNSSDISDVLMVVLAVCSFFLFSAF